MLPWKHDDIPFKALEHAAAALRAALDQAKRGLIERDALVETIRNRQVRGRAARRAATSRRRAWSKPKQPECCPRPRSCFWEVFLAATAILNTLLGILNERMFRRGRAAEPWQRWTYELPGLILRHRVEVAPLPCRLAARGSRPPSAPATG